MPARQDRSNTGAHRAFTNLKFSFTANQRRITDLNARHIGDRVKLSRCSVEWNPKITRANCLAFNNRRGGRMLDRLAREGVEHKHKQENEHETGALGVHGDQSTINYQPSTPKAFASRLFR